MSIGRTSYSPIRISGLSSGLDTNSIVDSLMEVERSKVSGTYRNKTTAEWKLEEYKNLNTKLTDFANKYFSVLSSDNIISSTNYVSYKANYTSNSAFKVSGTTTTIPGNYNVSAVTMATSAKVSGKDYNNSSIKTSDTLEQLATKTGTSITGDKLSFTVNGKEFSFSKDTTISQMVNTVNTSDAGVKLYYSEISNSFSFTSTGMGSSSKVEVANANGSNALDVFGITQATATGQDASITINGEVITKNSNTFTIDGMKFELTGNYQASGADTGYGISFSKDTDTAVTKMKGFIEEYNKLIDELYGKVTQKKDYDYYPLTEAEKKALDNDEEVDLWTNKAKEGLMRNDTVISGLLSDLRRAAYSIVGDTGMMACDIGITTSGKEGKLKLDEEKFAAALADNPEKVSQIMTGTSTATDSAQKYSESGFAQRLNITLSNYRSNIRANQINQYTQKIYDYSQQILKIEDKLTAKETALWNQYASLETLMTNMNSQSNWLSTQLSYL